MRWVQTVGRDRWKRRTLLGNRGETPIEGRESARTGDSGPKCANVGQRLGGQIERVAIVSREIDAVLGKFDTERGRKTCRSASEVSMCADRSAKARSLGASKDLAPTNEYTGGTSSRPDHDIDHAMHAVGEVDKRLRRLAKHDSRPRCLASESV